jgi:hypothetical protein
MNRINENSSQGLTSTERMALFAGIAYTALLLGAIVFFIANIAPHLPPLDASLAQKVAMYDDHGAMIRMNNYMWVLPVPFFLVFLGGLYSVLRRAEGDSSALSMGAFASGIALIVPWITNVAVETLAVSIAENSGDPAVVWALDGLGPTGTMGLNGLARAAFLFAASFILLKSHIAPRWIGWFGMILAVVNFAGSFIFAVETPMLLPAAWLSVPLTAIWVLALSIALLRQNPGVQRASMEHALAS